MSENSFLKTIFVIVTVATVVCWIATIWRYENVRRHCSPTNEVRTVRQLKSAGKVTFPVLVKQRKYICPWQPPEVWQ